MLVAAVFLVFGQTLRHDFVNYDDDQYFYSNPHVKGGLAWSGVAWAFQTGYASNWHPLTWLSLMLDAQLFGTGAAGPHLTNVILHAANTVLLFLLLKKLAGARWRSAVVAAVFAIHPLHVESVAWISERKDVLSGLFFMLTLLMYARYAERIPTPKAGLFYGLALLFFAMGLMSKPMLVTLPFVLLLLDWWPLKRFEPSTFNSQHETTLRLGLEKLPFFLLSAASCVVTVFVQREAVKSMVSLPLADRLHNALVSCVTYLAQMFWPENLAVFYPYHLDPPVWQIAGAGALLFSMTLLAILAARRFPYFPVGWFWYLGMLVPVIGLVQAGSQAHADRYTYLPQIGLYLVIAWAVKDLTASWRHRRQLFGVATCGMTAILMACAWKQTTYWRDGESLWRHDLGCTSGNFTAQNNLGYVLAGQGRIAEAVEHYKKALENYPDYAEADINLGRVFLDEGNLDEAAGYFQRAIKAEPGSAEAHNDLGILFVAQGKAAEAEKNYQKAIELNPDFAQACNNLAILLASQGRFAEAVQYYQRTLEIDPDYAEAHDNFGILLARQGRLAEAMWHFQKALEIRGGSAEANNDLGLLLVSLGQASEAVKHYQKALELKPDYAEAHYNLGIILAKLGNLPEAVWHLEQALQINPDSAVAHDSLGVALANQGRYAEAMKHFQKALYLADDKCNSTLAEAVRKQITQIKFYQTNAPHPPKP
jgi:tetratricopeptide (TPR) repeat protein